FWEEDILETRTKVRPLRPFLLFTKIFKQLALFHLLKMFKHEILGKTHFGDKDESSPTSATLAF
ncbi:hypothetical protein, partial [Vibrio vulnificus]|uniref:hypothetical protein n=1 Tax=Vibrio vulnificus TaxID=672 RepID=UPI0019D460C7